jgi:hypothetical protein
MKGYRRVYVRPGMPELAARRKRREEERRVVEEMLAQMKDATADQPGPDVTAQATASEPKDATQLESVFGPHLAADIQRKYGEQP